MLKEKQLAKHDVDQEVYITHMFHAPPELVFAAWTDPAQLVKWFAPHGCTVIFESIDVRPGGNFRSCISNPAFGDCWCRGTFEDVTFPERLVYTIANTDEHGNLASAADLGMDPEWPTESRVTVTFEDIAGKTKLTLRQTVNEALAKRTGAHPSWIQMLDRLESLLPQSK